MDIVITHDPIPNVIYTSQSVKSSLITMWPISNDQLEPLDEQSGYLQASIVKETCLIAFAPRNNMHTNPRRQTGPHTSVPISYG